MFSSVLYPYKKKKILYIPAHVHTAVVIRPSKMLLDLFAVRRMLFITARLEFNSTGFDLLVTFSAPFPIENAVLMLFCELLA